MSEECSLDKLGLSEIKLRGKKDMSFVSLEELNLGWSKEEI